jgi:hypothetical protein
MYLLGIWFSLRSRHCGKSFAYARKGTSWALTSSARVQVRP